MKENEDVEYTIDQIICKTRLEKIIELCDLYLQACEHINNGDRLRPYFEEIRNLAMGRDEND